MGDQPMACPIVWDTGGASPTQAPEAPEGAEPSEEATQEAGTKACALPAPPPGCRPAGIYSAGTAQRLVNMEGLMPGRDVVFLGSGDIGLIMARRMTLEGAKVLCVAELMPYSGGLKRNIVQCLDDFGIPLKLSHTVVDIQGKERVTGITLARVENGKPVPGTEEHYDCDKIGRASCRERV